ncbi:MAG: hypothetical protein ACRERC_19325, partial [Candidatus Binatia bacterium]
MSAAGWSVLDRGRSRVAGVPARAAVPVLLAVFVGLAGYSAGRDSATFDEGFHIAAGVACLERADYRLNPEHPPLAKMWMALPVWLAG